MKYLLASAAALIISSAATAADFYEPPAAIEPALIARDWTGFNVGLHGGYGWAELQSQTDKDPFDRADLSGPVVGGQIGLSQQWSDWFVLGVELDASWAGIDLDGDEEEGIDWLASARLRAGAGLDRFFLYGTGGVGFAGINIDPEDNAELGWVAGLGSEYMVTDNVTVGADYLHYRFGGDNVDTDVDVLRGRLNFKFGSFGPLR
jgi:outer membrane immunogenic protein